MDITPAHRFWIDLMNNPAVDNPRTAEALAWEAAEYNADVTGQERGFAERSEPWFRIAQSAYLEMLPIKRAELEG